MKKKKAIAILKKLGEELATVNVHTCNSWQSKTESYIKKFFGDTSAQHSFIKDYNFTVFGVGSAEWQINSARPFFKTYIDDCIEVLGNIGLKKKEWKHIFLTTHPILFWSIFTAAIGFSFWIGTITGKAAYKSNEASNHQTADKDDSSHVGISQKNFVLSCRN